MVFFFQFTFKLTIGNVVRILNLDADDSTFFADGEHP